MDINHLKVIVTVTNYFSAYLNTLLWWHNTTQPASPVFENSTENHTYIHTYLNTDSRQSMLQASLYLVTLSLLVDGGTSWYPNAYLVMRYDNSRIRVFFCVNKIVNSVVETIRLLLCLNDENDWKISRKYICMVYICVCVRMYEVYYTKSKRNETRNFCVTKSDIKRPLNEKICWLHWNVFRRGNHLTFWINS